MSEIPKPDSFPVLPGGMFYLAVTRASWTELSAYATLPECVRAMLDIKEADAREGHSSLVDAQIIYGVPLVVNVGVQCNVQVTGAQGGIEYAATFDR